MRGYYGIGVYHPKTEENIGTLWRSAFLYDAAFIFTIGRRYKEQCSDTTKSFRSIPMYHYLDFASFYRHMPYDCRLVCIELSEQSRSLPNFTHPDRCIYLLGAEDYGLPLPVTQGQLVVQIPAPKPMSTNVAVAGSIVIYDRYVKRGI
jgi:tRNA(Leu) C34 or U34 (ribose-2'-O)-methylase TrmL